jgi:outer membrane protein assembly factor BamB
MRNMSTRMLAAVTAGAVLGTLALAGASAPQAAGAPHAAGAPAAPGTQLWVSRYNGPGHDGDDAAAVAASPDGQTVFVTGSSIGAGPSSTSQYATIAYQASTGAQRWVRRYDNPGGTVDNVVSVAVSSAGLVFVTGWSSGAGPGGIATVAYSAATGAFQWATLYQAPRGEDVSSMAVSPDGKTVFITGTRYRSGSGSDYLTVAYRAATGAQLWVRRYHGRSSGFNAAASVAVSPSGRTVFVTGTSNRGRKGNSNLDYATVAYRAATGARLWVSRYNGPPDGNDSAAAVVPSPDGRMVFVTGSSAQRKGRLRNGDYATVAYRAATGARVWARRYNGPGNRDDSAAAVVPSTDGRTVFVTGTSAGIHSHEDWATVAYRAATGARLWVKRHDGPVSSVDVAASLAVSPAGLVFVTGDGWLDSPQNRTAPSEYVTIAYRAATGARLWARHYQNGSADQAGAISVAVSPAGLVFVTGTSQRDNGDGDNDYATIAYSG